MMMRDEEELVVDKDDEVIDEPGSLAPPAARGRG